MQSGPSNRPAPRIAAPVASPKPASHSDATPGASERTSSAYRRKNAGRPRSRVPRGSEPRGTRRRRTPESVQVIRGSIGARRAPSSAASGSRTRAVVGIASNGTRIAASANGAHGAASKRSPRPRGRGARRRAGRAPAHSSRARVPPRRRSPARVPDAPSSAHSTPCRRRRRRAQHQVRGVEAEGDREQAARGDHRAADDERHPPPASRRCSRSLQTPVTRAPPCRSGALTSMTIPISSGASLIRSRSSGR